MGKKSRLKKEVLQNTTLEERREIKQRRRDKINARQSQVEWIEKQPSNELKYFRGYIACWGDKNRYIGHQLQPDGSVKQFPYKPLLRGTFAIKDRV